MAKIPDYLIKRYNPLKELARAYGVKLAFGSSSSPKAFSYAQPQDNKIYINIKSMKNTYLKKRQVFSLFFHELAHIFIYREGKFPFANKIEYNSESEIIAYKKTVLHFELYTDNYGEKLMKLWFPKIKYAKNYRTKNEKIFLKKLSKEIHQEFLKENENKITHLLQRV